MSDSEAELSGVSGTIKGNLANVKEERWSYLCAAVKAGRIKIVRFLLQEGTEVNREDVDVNTPLHFAAEQGNEEIIRLLVEKRARIDAPNDQDETPLHLAAARGFLKIVNLLLSNSADVNAQNYKYSTPLLLAAESQHEDVVKTLLEHGAYVNAKDLAGNTPLYFAIEKKNSSLVNCILKHTPLLDDKIHKLVVHIVVHDDPQNEIVEHLINFGFRPNREDISGHNLLYVAVIKGYTKLVEHLLNHDADAVRNSSLFQCAVGMGHKEIIKLFLNLGCEVKGTDIIDYVPVCSLEDSNESNNVEIIQLLLSSGADVRDAPTSLHKAVDEGCIRVCEILLKNGVDIHSLDERGYTPLHVAVAKKYSQDEGEEFVRGKIIRLLLDNGGDLNFKTADGLAVIHRAVLNKRVDAIRILLEHGIEIDSRAGDGTTPLHVAAAEGHTELTNFFLNKKANVDARRRDGSTPLHMSASAGHSEVTKLLVEFEADIDARTTTNETAILLAVCKKHHEVVAVLLNSGCDVNVRNSSGEGALDIITGRRDANVSMSRSRREFFQDNLNLGNYNPLNLISDDNPLRFIPFDPFATNDIFGPSTFKLFRMHAIKLKVSGLCVYEELLQLISKSVDAYGLSGFQQQCEEELSRMNGRKCGTYTLLELLAGPKNPTFARDKSLMQAFESFDFTEFPIYCGLIINRFRRSKQKIALLGAGQKSLEILFKISNIFKEQKSPALPAELLDEIVSHLNDVDLRSLICCSQSFKTLF